MLPAGSWQIKKAYDLLMASGFIAFLLGIFLWSSEESIQQKK